MFSFFKKRMQKQTEEQEPFKSLNIPSNLEDALNILKNIYSLPVNQDFKIRRIYIPSLEREAAICFFDGITNQQLLENQVINPLVHTNHIEIRNVIKDLSEKVIESKALEVANNFEKVVNAINVGIGALFIDGESEVILLATAEYPQRSISVPQNEHVIIGPNEAFIENGQINRALIRKQIRSEHLITESIIVGKQVRSDITIMYMKNIVDDDLVKAIKERIKKIDIDSVQDIGMLEQHLEERPYSLIPSMMLTERPDRVVSFLLEGHVTMVHNSSAYALVAPVTFWDLFHSSEDTYVRWPYGTFIRILRLVSVFLALHISPIFLALTNYHNEMIPTDLLFAIAGTRETVPFPTIMELFIMEFSFEMIREAGLRVPSPMGQMIGIVGALILGQAAVQANVVSPILIIIVALGGVASFAIPTNSLGYLIRISKFIYIFFAATFGLVGLAFIIIAYTVYAISIKSFDVPFLAPMAPHYKGPNDTIFRPQVWKNWLRPGHLYTKNQKSAKKPEGNNRQ